MVWPATGFRLLGYPLVPPKLTRNPILVVHMVCCLTHMLEESVFNSRPRDLQVSAVGTFELGNVALAGYPDALLPRP